MVDSRTLHASCGRQSSRVVPLRRMNNPPVFGVLQVSQSASCPLFVIALLCAGRQARPSATTLCKRVREMKIKPVQQEPSGLGFAGLIPCWVLLKNCCLFDLEVTSHSWAA